MFYRIAFLVTLLWLVGCVSTVATPTALPPATLPIATGIPVTPKPATPRAQAAPTATVETLPTPENEADMFSPAADLLKSYQPPESDPQPLYDALAQGIGEFLAVTANGDVSMQGQPALTQISDAIKSIPNMPEKAEAQAAAIHIGDDQGGSRDVIYVAVTGLMGMPVIALERIGSTYETLAPVTAADLSHTDERYFYLSELKTQDVTGDDIPELVYGVEYPGASGTTNALSIERWLAEEKQLHPIFRVDLINWAGESDYSIETTADAASLKLTFPWFGAFDHKLLSHPNAVQTWEYDDAQDKFVQVSLSVEDPKTSRQALNAGEYAFRNGDLEAALALYERAWNDPTLEKEDFSESKADPAAFAKFRQAMLLNLLGRSDQARPLLDTALKSGDALAQVADTYNKNASGRDAAIRGWIAMANAGDLYNLIYESKAGNLDFPFDAQEVYVQGGILSAYLNTHTDADRNPDSLWSTLAGLGYKPVTRASADLNGDGINEFFVVTQEGGDSPNQAQSLWFVYRHQAVWRVRSLDIADTVQFEGDPISLPNNTGKALKLKLPEDYDPNEVAVSWDGSQINWLDAKTLEPGNKTTTSVGGGVLEDDF